MKMYIICMYLSWFLLPGGNYFVVRRLKAFSETQLFFHFSAFVLLLYASGYTRLKQLPSEATHINELGKTSILRLEI